MSIFNDVIDLNEIEKIFPKNRKLESTAAQYISIDFSEYDMSNTYDRNKFIGNFSKFRFYATGANLNGFDFSDHHLNYADLNHADLVYDKFSRAVLRKANLSHTYLFSTSFDDAVLTEVDFSGSNSILVKDEMSNSYKQFVEFTYDKIIKSNPFFNHSLAINFWYANLEKVNFIASCIPFINFYGATIKETNFTRANLTRAIFKHANLYNANFTGADLILVNFEMAKLKGKNDFTGAKLKGMEIDEYNLPYIHIDDVASADMKEYLQGKGATIISQN